MKRFGDLSEIDDLKFRCTNGANSYQLTVTPATQTGDGTLTVPDMTGGDTMVLLGATQTLINKTLESITIDGSVNTISNLVNAHLASNAAIAWSKLAAGSVNRIATTDGFGVLSEIGAPSSNHYLKWNGSSYAWDVPAGSGDVLGISSSTDNTIPRFDGITGKQLQSSSVVVDDSDNVSGIANLTITGTASGITATHVGLGNCDNTSDADKPISDLTQTALNSKAAVTLTTDGDILYYNSGYQRLAKGTDTQVLTLASGVPSWVTPSLGGAYILAAPTLRSVALDGESHASITGTDNTFYGAGAGATVINGNYNTFIGGLADGIAGSTKAVVVGYGSTGATYSTTIGVQAEAFTQAVSIGYNAGNVSSTQSVVIGVQAGQSNASRNNVAIGYQAGMASGAGEYNVFIGSNCGTANTGTGYNVFIGRGVGATDRSVSNKLLIHNSDVAIGSNLIEGDFTGTPKVTVNGAFEATGLLTCKEVEDSTTTTSLNNYSITSTFISFTGSASITLSGIVAQSSGTIIRIYNGTGNNFTLLHMTTSTATNQLRNRSGVNDAIGAGETVSYIYGQDRWNQL